MPKDYSVDKAIYDINEDATCITQASNICKNNITALIDLEVRNKSHRFCT